MVNRSLINKMKKGDVDARNTLLAPYLDYVSVCTRAQYVPGCEEEDKVQIAMEWLLRYFHNYDPRRGSLKTFVARSVRYALGQWISKQNLQKRKVQFLCSSLTRHDDEDEQEHQIPVVEDLHEHQERHEQLNRLLATLNPEDRAYMEGWLDRDPQWSITDKYMRIVGQLQEHANQMFPGQCSKIPPVKVKKYPNRKSLNGWKNRLEILKRLNTPKKRCSKGKRHHVHIETQ